MDGPEAYLLKKTDVGELGVEQLCKVLKAGLLRERAERRAVPAQHSEIVFGGQFEGWIIWGSLRAEIVKRSLYVWGGTSKKSSLDDDGVPWPEAPFAEQGF